MNSLPTTPNSLFLEQGDHLLWVEVVRVSFSRREISDFLTKARQIQSRFPSGISGVIVAPDFEDGVQELMELVRIPIRLFKYREATSPFSGSEGWLEEITVARKAEEPPEEEPPTLSYRLNREELREFIQLEIDDASGKYNKS